MAINICNPGANPDDVQTLLNLKSNLASPVFTGVPKLPVYTLSTLPAVGTIGGVIIVSNANTGAGTVAWSNGTNWVDIKTGLPVA